MAGTFVRRQRAVISGVIWGRQHANYALAVHRTVVEVAHVGDTHGVPVTGQLHVMLRR